MDEHLKILWQTYDFILNKIVPLEDELAYIIKNKGETKKLKQISIELRNAYNKQLLSIKELQDFYKKHPEDIEEGRKVSIESFQELKDVTGELKRVMEDNIADF